MWTLHFNSVPLSGIRRRTSAVVRLVSGSTCREGPESFTGPLWPHSISHVGEDESAEGKLVGQILLGGLGVLLLAAGVWGYFGGQNDKIAGGFFVLVGLLLVVLAAFYSHIDGIVELGLLKIPMVKARRAEKQIEQGQVVAGNNLEGARKALEEALSRYNVSQFGAPTVTQEPALSETEDTPNADAEPASSESTGDTERESSDTNADRGPRLGRNVLLVENAVFTMATLTPHEQVLVRTEVARMSRPDFHTDLDLRATRPRDAGRSYRMHRVPEADIRLWYRQKSESEPHTLYVMVIEKTGEDLR
jgi:hypothetical protein